MIWSIIRLRFARRMLKISAALLRIGEKILEDEIRQRLPLQVRVARSIVPTINPTKK